ncbi:MAG: two-component sensor histidine kinase [Gammaproteobacteria bacterium]|nr:two-component sensor histidine kinase [Gammaproteobacteria bacterium]
MTATKFVDLNQALRIIGLLIVITLILLFGLAIVLSFESERRLLPLQQDTEALSEVETQLLQLVNRDKPTTDSSQEDPEIQQGILQSIEVLSGQVRQNLDDLEKAQENITSLTHTASAVILILVLMLTVLAWLAYHRVLRPVYALSKLLRRLSHRDFSPVSMDDADSMLDSVFKSYNILVNRLAQLERAHAERHEEMERRVASAIGQLMIQRAELSRTERLAAMGEMAATLAHEIRNPLAAIHAACSSLRADIEEEDYRKRLGLVISEVDRLTVMVREQLNSTRYNPEPHSDTELNALILDLVKLLRYQMPENVHLDVDLKAPIYCSLPVNGLRRSLLNLILNAQQALMPEGGNIQVKTVNSDAGIEIVIEDNGPGFPESLIEQGIRRFNTLRSGGTGLGLAMIKRYIDELSGRCTIENSETGGARVILFLPEKIDTPT